jgi:hypothetical protein
MLDYVVPNWFLPLWGVGLIALGVLAGIALCIALSYRLAGVRVFVAAPHLTAPCWPDRPERPAPVAKAPSEMQTTRRPAEPGVREGRERQPAPLRPPPSSPPSE